MMLNPIHRKLPLADDALYEIVDGEKIEVGPMSRLAGQVAVNIIGSIRDWQKVHPDIGTLCTEDLFFMPITGRSRRPDVAFISFAKMPYEEVIEPEGDYPMAPDLAVEVISPNDLDKEIQSKLRDYFANGVQQVWHVRPEDRSVTVYDSPKIDRILDGQDRLQSPVLPGFDIAVESLFPQLKADKTA